MTWLYLGICTLTSGFSGNIYKELSGVSKSRAATCQLGSGLFIPLFLFFGIRWLCDGHSSFSVPAAAVGGVCIALAVTALIESMKLSALSVSVVIMNLSFIIPILLSAVFLRERALPFQLCGMLLAVGVIILMNLGDRTVKKGYKSGVRWAVLACISNGGYNFCLKVNENEGGGEGFFALAYLCAALVCLLLFALLFRKPVSGEKRASRQWLKLFGWLLLLSFLMGLEYLLMAKLAGRLNATVQFTAVTVSGLLLSIAVGVLFQGEKLTKKAVFSALLCVAAIFFQFFSI